MRKSVTRISGSQRIPHSSENIFFPFQHAHFDDDCYAVLTFSTNVQPSLSSPLLEWRGGDIHRLCTIPRTNTTTTTTTMANEINKRAKLFFKRPFFFFCLLILILPLRCCCCYLSKWRAENSLNLHHLYIMYYCIY